MVCACVSEFVATDICEWAQIDGWIFAWPSKNYILFMWNKKIHIEYGHECVFGPCVPYDTENHKIQQRPWNIHCKEEG